MTHKKDNRLKILVIITIVLVLGGVAVAVLFGGQSNDAQAEKAALELETQDFDFGEISMASGTVSKIINIKNTGSKNLKITRLLTSCMCTEVTLKVKDETSQKFGMPGHGPTPLGWSQIIEPGENGKLEIYFDPNAHGPNGTGPITRSVTLVSNTGGKSGRSTDIKFSGNVIK